MKSTEDNNPHESKMSSFIGKTNNEGGFASQMQTLRQQQSTLNPDYD